MKCVFLMLCLGLQSHHTPGEQPSDSLLSAQVDLHANEAEKSWFISVVRETDCARARARAKFHLIHQHMSWLKAAGKCNVRESIIGQIPAEPTPPVGVAARFVPLIWSYSDVHNETSAQILKYEILKWKQGTELPPTELSYVSDNGSQVIVRSADYVRLKTLIQILFNSFSSFST